MRRVTSVLLAVLLGALATAIGMGVFLKLANDDRERLATEAAQAKAAADRAEQEKRRFADEANKKVEDANDEVAKAQRILQAVVEERELMATAKRLAVPSARELRGWQPVVSLPQGLGLSLPPGTTVESDDARSLTSVKKTFADFLTDARWLSVTPYNARLERELDTALATSTNLSYVADGRLLLGRIGALTGANDRVAVLRVQESASSTHLIWIKDPGTLGGGNGFERLLGTLEFRD
ncbi:MAG TPA: hypothetical protein VN397_00470 [Candidatus Methylomirabilis sp.]|nr:hypothetical protein [Candidatus Methylomirabilis sp.]